MRAMQPLCLVNESKHAEVACARQLYTKEGVAGFTRGEDLPVVVEVEVLKTQIIEHCKSRLDSVKSDGILVSFVEVRSL